MQLNYLPLLLLVMPVTAFAQSGLDLRMVPAPLEEGAIFLGSGDMPGAIADGSWIRQGYGARELFQ